MSALLIRLLRGRPRTPRLLRLALALLSAAGALTLLAAQEGSAGSGTTGTAAGSAVGSATGSAVGSATGSAVGSATGSAVGSASPAVSAGLPVEARHSERDKSPVAPAPGEALAPTPTSPALVAQGRSLYATDCSSCHGMGLRGRANVAPSLIGVGAGPTDFYLSTGRMPLENPRLEPMRGPVRYSRGQIQALVAFVAAFGGPPAPDARPARGDLALGLHDFALDCAGCHQIVARGGLTLGAVVPDLQSASARQIAEAVRMGPYLMPRFGAKQLDQHALDSVARYVLWTRRPSNEGGWGLYNIGPIPEGMVAWFLLLLSLVLFARLIGERAA
jgi:quinol---cytochrome-c reductase cytochrome c subunit